MKKVLSFVLALIMVMALSVTAFALDSVPQTSDKNVTAGYEAGEISKTATVYSFTIAWETTDHDFAYCGEKATYTWNANTLQYDVNNATHKAAGWYGSADVKVTVTNRSEVALDFETNVKTNTYNLNIAADNNITKQTVNSATIDKDDNKSFTYKDAGKTGTEQSASISYTIKGTTDSDAIDTTTATAKDNVVATLTVTVNEATT